MVPLRRFTYASRQTINGAGMKTNHLAIAALSALVCVLAWTVFSRQSTLQSYTTRPVVTTGINWEHQPEGCERECLKGYRWGIQHEVTERKDCRTLAPDALAGCLLVVQAVERFNAEDVVVLYER